MTIFDFETIYSGRKVFLTGSTGFKGSWLALWLTHLGASVHGYALEPPTDPSLFNLLELDNIIEQETADIRDRDTLKSSIRRAKPDVIFHLAAQSLVRESYISPLDTVAVNTLGTVHLMEAVREVGLPTAMVMVTSDKCYRNREWLHGYRETDPLGGYDPYSASKAGAELFIDSWRNSFFNPADIGLHGMRIASARAGNVIGGGDWTTDNLVPDCIRALQRNEVIDIRNPNATRPWQHVLEALSGYLLLGAKLMDPVPENARPYCDAFNFGPTVSSNRAVEELVEKVIECWGGGSWRDVSSPRDAHEASLLSIAFDKAYHMLGWHPQLDFNATVRQTIEWYKEVFYNPSDAMSATLNQIRSYGTEQAKTVKMHLSQAIRP